MKKRIILSTTLGLGLFYLYTDEAHAASKLHDFSANVSIIKNNTSVYSNSSLKKVSKKAKSDTVYEVNGYRIIKGSKYYRVYQGKYAGYIKASQAKTVKYKKYEEDAISLKSTPTYSNLFFNKKKGKISKNKKYETRGYYTLASGKRIYSLEDDRTDRWVGYVNQKAIRLEDDDRYDDDRLHSEKTKVSVIKNNTSVYSNSSLKKVSKKAKSDTVYEVNGYRIIKGSKYYRVYQGKYAGYIKASQAKTVKYYKAKNDDARAIKSSILWSDLFFSKKKGKIKVGKTYDVKGYYRLASGKRIYSLEDEHTDRWVGYVEQKAIRLEDDDRYDDDRYDD